MEDENVTGIPFYSQMVFIQLTGLYLLLHILLMYLAHPNQDFSSEAKFQLPASEATMKPYVHFTTYFGKAAKICNTRNMGQCPT